MLKDQLFKRSGLQFDNWLIGPRKVLDAFEKQALNIGRCQATIITSFHAPVSIQRRFKLIAKRSNRNYVITFDSHLKTALIVLNYASLLIGQQESRLYLKIPQSVNSP